MPRASPLKRSSLPQPGDSTRRRADDLLFDRIGIYMVYPGFCVGTAVMLWIYWLMNVSMFHAAITVTAAIPLAALLVWYRYRRHAPTIRDYRLGEQGERTVGQQLNALHAMGYRVFHDIPCHGRDGVHFNIDHALIGPAGVIAVETKTWRKDDSNLRNAITWNGSVLCRNDFAVPGADCPVTQAVAAAVHLRHVLSQHTRTPVPHVLAVATFPGWWVNEFADDRCAVLNPDRIAAWLAQQPSALSPATVTELAQALHRYHNTAT